jgi:hypothetical protein
VSVPPKSSPVTSCIPSLAQSNVVGVCSPGLVLHTQRIIALLFLWSLCRSPAVGAHVSLPCSNAEHMHASIALPIVVKDRCLDVRIGMSFLNFLQAVQCLTAMSPRYQKLVSTSSRVPSTSTSVTSLPSMGLALPQHLGQM